MAISFTRYAVRLGSTLTLSAALALTAQAQNVSMKGDVITVDKKPYAKLLKGGTMMMRDFTLLTLDDKEVMKAKGNIVALPSNESFIYYMMTFQPGGETAEMSKTGLNFQQQLAEALVKNEVMRDGQPNPEGIKRFTEAFGEKLSAKYAAEKEAQANAKPLDYKIVERNRFNAPKPRLVAPPRRSETTWRIMQGDVLIGVMRPKESTSSIQTLYTFALPDGFEVAELTVYPSSNSEYSGGVQGTSYKLHVKKDNKYHNNSAVGGPEAARQQVVEYLVSGGYL
ncbi:hypothetical protein [Hymenobacter metallilatus]|uniref:DUF4412 domain-containing protein n=1 Tax=Hymenobacter metallilatus TaxID=2493666 RepID=A0A428JIH1_9BACT|nr:hypothetical protein [Hymenobacter metallilatus]RSK32429.1 hypothetical protein EI290_11910 [Hymenobacter metallilatus]